MNGDSHSSRGMASTNALPRIRKHDTDSSHPTADAGRYGSSREQYVSRIRAIEPASKASYYFSPRLAGRQVILLTFMLRAPEMTVEPESLEIVIIAAQTVDAPDRPTTEAPDLHAASRR